MKPATRTLSIRMIAASLAAAGAIFGGLAVQMAHGHDPALGAGTSTSTSQSHFSQQDQSSGSSQQDQSSGSPSGVVTRAS
jgi:hypothetical protein